MVRLSNNKSNELGLWEELVRKLQRLEELGGVDRPFAGFLGGTGVAIKVPDLSDGTEVGYTIYLDPFQLRVTWGRGNGPHRLRPYGITRRFLCHVIAEIEKAIAWKEHNILLCEKIAQELEDMTGPVCPCGHTYAQHDTRTGQCCICECTRFGEPLENWETHTVE